MNPYLRPIGVVLFSRNTWRPDYIFQQGHMKVLNVVSYWFLNTCFVRPPSFTNVNLTALLGFAVGDITNRFPGITVWQETNLNIASI